MAPVARVVESDRVLQFWLRKNSEPRLKLLEKVYLDSHRCRSEL